MAEGTTMTARLAY